MIRVLIADDHPVVRGGLRDGLTAEADMQVIAEAGNGIEAEKAAIESRPDVILMDLSMPHRNGIDTMAAIKQKLPHVKVLILTVSEEGDDLARAVRLGADGYLLKNTGIDNIVASVRKVAAGESILSPDLASILMKGIKEEVIGPPLSERETEVLQLLAEGLTTSGIAKRLRLSPATVGTYVSRLMEKLHLKNRAAAIIYAARHYPPAKKP